MKLEEVLPAMREGRVARWDGKQFVLRKRPLPSGGFKLIESDGLGLWNEADIVADMLDGWTLEPEPKVEWPKGSIQKALESKDPGVEARIIRRAWLGAMCGKGPLKMADININNISPLDLLALDWEIVP